MSEFKLEFGRRLKSIRKQRKMSLEEMAALLGTSKQVLSRYETGQRTPKVTTAREYAEQLGVPLTYLLGEDEAAAPEPSVPGQETITIIGKNGQSKIYHVPTEKVDLMQRFMDFMADFVQDETDGT